MNARKQFIAEVGEIVRACTTPPKLPVPTLTPVPQTLECPTCEGLERVVTGQAADGCIHDAPCPNRECNFGFIRNPDWEPLLMTCPCGRALLPGDDCRLCGTHYLETAA